MPDDYTKNDQIDSLARVGLQRRYNSKTKTKGNFLINSPVQPTKNIYDITEKGLPFEKKDRIKNGPRVQSLAMRKRYNLTNA